jgi:hypothetical protein
MEALCEWLLNDGTALASHESGKMFHMLRDVNFAFKFLATMETREQEQMRKRSDKRTWQSWRLSFEQKNRHWGWGAARAPTLQWEVTNFRGIDQDTADIEVTGMQGRNLKYGEGGIVHSPSSVASMLNLHKPSEDDVLHADKLPTFDKVHRTARDY